MRDLLGFNLKLKLLSSRILSLGMNRASMPLQEEIRDLICVNNSRVRSRLEDGIIRAVVLHIETVKSDDGVSFTNRDKVRSVMGMSRKVSNDERWFTCQLIFPFISVV